jgi:hypothetical protein
VVSKFWIFNPSRLPDAAGRIRSRNDQNARQRWLPWIWFFVCFAMLLVFMQQRMIRS